MDRVRPLRLKELNDKQVQTLVSLLKGETNEKYSLSATEKVAGQHVTMTVLFNKQNPSLSQVRVFTKDMITKAKSLKGGKDGRLSKWGSIITRALFSFFEKDVATAQILFANKEHQTWSFEMVNPNTNHDFIKYQTKNIVFCEFSGALEKSFAQTLQTFLPQTIRLLTLESLQVDISSLSKKILKTNFNKRNIGSLKQSLSGWMEQTLVSSVDGKSPVEGVVFKLLDKHGKDAAIIKCQTNTFLGLQKCQMPLYSLIKLSKEEKRKMFRHQTEPIKHLITLQTTYRAILGKNKQLSLVQTLEKYLGLMLKRNKFLKSLSSSYRVWFDKDEVKQLLLSNDSIKVFAAIYKRVKHKKLKL